MGGDVLCVCGSWKESVGTVDRGAVELAIGGGGGGNGIDLSVC
jgi:hypothetical protein